MSTPLRFAIALIVLTFAQDAAGQFAQYTPPGQGGSGRRAESGELDRLMSEARWRVGGVRMSPWFGIEGISYVDNVFAGSDEGVSDVTATLGGGITAYLPMGPDVVWIAEGGLRYFWWNELEERRQLGGRAGLALVGNFNRLGLVARAGRERDERIRSSEVPQRGLFETDLLSATATVHLGAKIDLFASGTLSTVEDLSDRIDDPRTVSFAAVDRDETILRGGLAWQPSQKVRIALGIEESTVDFAPGAADLSNEGTSPVLEIALTGNRLDLQAEIVSRSLDPQPGSRFTPFEEETGSLQASLETPGGLRATLYGQRQLVYSLIADQDYFTSDRFGLRVQAPLGRRTNLSAFVESGENSYLTSGASSPFDERRDDVQAYGVDASLRLGSFLQWSLGASQTDYDSNLPGLDRSLGSVQLGLAVSVDSLIWR